MAAWTPAEDAVLDKHYAAGGIDECVALLPGRTRQSVRNRASRLGLRIKPPNPNFRESAVGTMHRRNDRALAVAGARKLVQVRGPVAVSVDSGGRVWLQRPEDVSADELVGVYDPELGVVAISSVVRDDLAVMRDEMGVAA